MLGEWRRVRSGLSECVRILPQYYYAHWQPSGCDNHITLHIHDVVVTITDAIAITCCSDSRAECLACCLWYHGLFSHTSPVRDEGPPCTQVCLERRQLAALPDSWCAYVQWYRME